MIATTLRHAKTATLNDWGALCYGDGSFHEAPVRENLEIYDRVGGGDSFASGLIYGFLSGKGSAVVGRMRRRARRTGDDHARRHDHGDARGSSASHEIANRSHRAIRENDTRELIPEPYDH